MSSQGAAADHAEREPGALLVRKGDDLDRVVGLYTTFLHRLHDLDASEHPERPVEVPPVVHGVHVRANEDGRSTGILALPTSKEISDGVLANREAGLLHKGGNEVLGGPFFIWCTRGGSRRPTPVCLSPQARRACATAFRRLPSLHHLRVFELQRRASSSAPRSSSGVRP